MQDLSKELNTGGFLFVGLVTLSFSFAYICNNYLLKKPQIQPQINKIDDNVFLNSVDSNASINNAFKSSINIYYKNLGIKHKYDYSELKLNNLDLNVLKQVNNSSDFSNNWSVLNMNHVINTIYNLNPYEISESAANSWPLYVFLRLLSSSDYFIDKLNSDIPVDRMILNLINGLKLSGNFSGDTQIEFNKYLIFTKVILNNQSDESINVLLETLRNIYYTQLNC